MGWDKSNDSTGSGGYTPPANKSTLDKLNENAGQLTFNGVILAAGSNPTAVDRQTLNLFDKTRMTVGTHHDPASGNVISGLMETHKIYVKPKYNYVFNRADGLAVGHSFFDANDVYISGASAVKTKAPANASYMYVRIANTTIAEALMVMETNYMFADYVPYTQKFITTQPVQGWYRSQWYEKVWWVLGDSVSTGWGDGVGAGNAYAAKPYHYVLARERNIRVQNEAVSGYTIAQIYDNKVVSMPPTENSPDLITIMAGGNDYNFNVAIGTVNDATSASTFYGVYKKTIEELRTRYPFATIGLITPMNKKTDSTDGNTPNAAGFTRKQYAEAVKSIANYYCLNVLDIYENIGFTPYDSVQRANFYCNGDGNHPNDIGHLRMAARIGDFIEKL